MKFSKWTLAFSLAGTLLVGHAQAQSLDTTLASDAYYAQGKDNAPSPSDKLAPQPAPQAQATDGGGNGCCDNGCGNDCGCCKPECRKCCDSLCGVERCCELECPDVDTKRFFDQEHCSGIKFYGWAQAGWTVNMHDPVDNFNGPVTFNDRDDLQLNQLYAVLEKPATTGECCWSLGWRADVLFGTDHRFTMARGLEVNQDLSNKWNGGRFYGVALPQLYADLAYNDTVIRVGHFYTTIGYEVVPSVNNFFYSHSYTMQYAEPFTHTGAMLTHKFNDRLSGHFAVHRGWDNWEDNPGQDQLDYLAGVTLTSEDSKSSLAFAITTGEEASAIGFANRTMYSAVYTQKMLCDRLTYVFQHDYGFQNDGDGTTAVPGGPFDAEWYGINQYLLYQLNCCWSAGMRFEWFRDDDGTRVSGIGAGNAIAGQFFPGNFYEITWGLNWKPNDNVTIRPEVRYDWFEGVGTPYQDGTDTEQLTAAIDLIIQW